MTSTPIPTRPGTSARTLVRESSLDPQWTAMTHEIVLRCHRSLVSVLPLVSC